MTADLVADGGFRLDTLLGLVVAILAFALALILLIESVAAFPFREKGWYKSGGLLASIGYLAAVGGLVFGGSSLLQNLQTGPEPGEGQTGIVQGWAEDSYGVRVSDDEADAMASAIRNPTRHTSTTFVVEGPAGVIQVKLVQDGDAEFHMVQAAAELPLSEVQK